MKDKYQERDLFSSGPVLTITWNPVKRGAIQQISPNVTDILGYTPEEITSPGFIYDEIIHPDDRDKQRIESKTYQEKRLNCYSQSYRLKTKEGAYRWFYDQTQCIQDRKGNIVGYIGYLMDQTPLMESQQALETERRRLADIIEATHVGTWERNTQTGEVWVNHRWAEIIGYTLEELEPITIDTWIANAHPEDLKASEDQLQELYNGSREYYDIECRMKHKDGHWVWVQDRGKVVSRTEEGTPLMVSGTHTDITQRKEDQKRIADSKNLLNSVFHSIQDGITVLDADLTIIETNHIINKLYGTKGPFIGEKCYQVSRNRSTPCEICPSLQALQQKKACSAVIPLQVKGQQKGWLEIFSYPLIDQSTGNIDGVVEFVRDITDRMKLEEELRSQNGLITSLINSIPDLVFYKDLDGVFLGCNQAFADQVGLQRENIIGKTDYDLHPKEEADNYRHHDMKVLRSLETRHNEEWVTYPDGRNVLLDTLKTPYLDHGGSLLGILAISRDITERKQDEEALKIARQQAENANEAKNRYLAHMNHEMRTPLNGLMGFMGLMEKTTVLDQDQQEYLHHMQQSAGHLLSIVNNVLDHAKIEAGEMKLRHKTFILKDEVQAALATLHSLALKQGISLVLSLPDDLPQKIVGDAQRLRQIILNLAGNAVKFTEKGHVNITLACLETTPENHTLQLVVEDTGPGMSQENMSKLFQPFYQADDGSTTQSKGTGLGMTITKELVELMGGCIQVNSTLGEGTRVEVHLKLMKG